MLNELGYEARSYQENRRIQYVLKDVELDIDYWPMIPTYLEIEGRTEAAVYKVLAELGFAKKDYTTKDINKIYADYGYNLDEIRMLKLEEERK